MHHYCPAGKRNQEKTLPFGKEESALSLKQYTRAHLCYCNGEMDCQKKI